MEQHVQVGQIEDHHLGRLVRSINNWRVGGHQAVPAVPLAAVSWLPGGMVRLTLSDGHVAEVPADVEITIGERKYARD